MVEEHDNLPPEKDNSKNDKVVFQEVKRVSSTNKKPKLIFVSESGDIQLFGSEVSRSDDSISQPRDQLQDIQPLAKVISKRTLGHDEGFGAKWARGDEYTIQVNAGVTSVELRSKLHNAHTFWQVRTWEEAKAYLEDQVTKGDSEISLNLETFQAFMRTNFPDDADRFDKNKSFREECGEGNFRKKEVILREHHEKNRYPSRQFYIKDGRLHRFTGTNIEGVVNIESYRVVEDQVWGYKEFSTVTPKDVITNIPTTINKYATWQELFDEFRSYGIQLDGEQPDLSLTEIRRFVLDQFPTTAQRLNTTDALFEEWQVTDPDGTIQKPSLESYIGTANGLYIYDKSNGSFTAVNNLETDNKGRHLLEGKYREVKTRRNSASSSDSIVFAVVHPDIQYFTMKKDDFRLVSNWQEYLDTLDLPGSADVNWLKEKFSKVYPDKYKLFFPEEFTSDVEFSNDLKPFRSKALEFLSDQDFSVDNSILEKIGYLGPSDGVDPQNDYYSLSKFEDWAPQILRDEFSMSIARRDIKEKMYGQTEVAYQAQFIGVLRNILRHKKDLSVGQLESLLSKTFHDDYESQTLALTIIDRFGYLATPQDERNNILQKSIETIEDDTGTISESTNKLSTETLSEASSEDLVKAIKENTYRKDPELNKLIFIEVISRGFDCLPLIISEGLSFSGLEDKFEKALAKYKQTTDTDTSNIQSNWQKMQLISELLDNYSSDSPFENWEMYVTSDDPEEKNQQITTIIEKVWESDPAKIDSSLEDLFDEIIVELI